MADIPYNKHGFPLEKFLGFSTIFGTILTSSFFLCIIGIAIYAVNHVLPNPVGDELFYIISAQKIGTNGIYAELAHGNPIGYTLIVYLISKIGISTLLSARILSLISTLVVIISTWIIAKKYFNLNNSYRLLVLFTSLLGIVTSGNYLFVASDDMYYAVFLIWIAVYLWKAIETWSSWRKFALAGVLFAASLLIRPLTLIFFPASVVAIIFAILIAGTYKASKLLYTTYYVISFCIILLIQQYPSLHQNGKLSFENKMYDSVHTRANWIQKYTLTNLKKEKNEKLFENNNLASWKQCDEYLAKYGDNSLPSNQLSRVFWNPIFVLKYFLIGFLKMNYIFLRHTGIVLFLPIFFLVRRSNSEPGKIAFLTIFTITYLFLYLFAALNFVQTRHLIIPIIMLILCGSIVFQSMNNEGKKYAEALTIIQLCFLALILILDLNFYFILAINGGFYG